jgi:hypothetical protein
MVTSLMSLQIYEASRDDHYWYSERNWWRKLIEFVAQAG